jgi:hypothetical protein
MARLEFHPDVLPIVRELDEHRTRYVALCRSLSNAELSSPVPLSTWIVRDFIAHLATIDPTVLAIFRSIKKGPGQVAEQSSDEPFDIDRWNNARVAERRTWSVDRTLEEAAMNRGAMREFLATLDGDDLQKPFPFGGDSKRPPMDITLIQYLRGWCKHDVMHAVDMMRALPDRRTPDLDEWFDDPVVAGYQRAMNGGHG